MRIYTRKGDKGRTHVIGGRVDKDDLRVVACGSVDECNAAIGQAVALLNRDRNRDMLADLEEIQQQLFDAGADLAQMSQVHPFRIGAGAVVRLEHRIDRYEEETAPIRQFILPGGTPAAAALHVARTVVRRAERAVVTLSKEQTVNSDVRRYLNRLSDLLFVMARVANARDNVPDVWYRPERDNNSTDKNSDQMAMRLMLHQAINFSPLGTGAKNEGGNVSVSSKLTVYAYPRCGTCRKALKFLDVHGVPYDVRHVVDDPPSKETLKQMLETSGLEIKKFFNTSGKKYRELNMKEKVNELSEDELLTLLSENGMLIKRPIVTDGKRVTVGFNESEFHRVWLGNSI